MRFAVNLDLASCQLPQLLQRTQAQAFRKHRIQQPLGWAVAVQHEWVRGLLVLAVAHVPRRPLELLRPPHPAVVAARFAHEGGEQGLPQVQCNVMAAV